MNVGHWIGAAGNHVWRCPRCLWGRPHETRQSAEIVQAYHACEQRMAHGKEPHMPAGESLLMIAWRQLDETVDQIIDAENSRDLETRTETAELLKAAARGKAEILALFMAPHFDTADAISEEAARRYIARVAGDATYKTAGLL